jgi:hypothetical protein
MSDAYRYNIIFDKLLQRTGFTITEMAEASNTSFQNVKNHCDLRFIMSKRRFLSNVSYLKLYLEKKIASYKEMIKDTAALKEELKQIKEDAERD